MRISHTQPLVNHMAKRPKRYGGMDFEREEGGELERLGRPGRGRSSSFGWDREEDLDDDDLDLGQDSEDLDELSELDRVDRRR